MTNETYQHYGSVDDMGRKWRDLAGMFERDAEFLAQSVRVGERSWQEAFQILRDGYSGPISDEDLKDAVKELAELNPGGMV